MRVIGQRIKRMATIAVTAILSVSLASCGQATDDNRTEISVWSWEPSMGEVIRRFEKANPDIRVKWTNISGYGNLNTAIQDGYGTPDVAQIEYYALLQYAVSGQLLDLTDKIGSDYSNFFTLGTWSSVPAVPMDCPWIRARWASSTTKTCSAKPAWTPPRSRLGMTITRPPKSSRRSARISPPTRATAVSMTRWSGSPGVRRSGHGQPFHTSADGKTVTIDLDEDAGTQRFTEFWQKMIDEGLVDTTSATWSDRWKSRVGTGTIASVFSGAWMPSLLLSNVPGAAGLWRVAPMPTYGGQPANAENGGSALTVLQLTRKPDAAYRFVDFVAHDAQGISARVDGGAFPADYATLNSADFLDKTTITNDRGIEIPYFGGQKFNRVLSEAAEDVSVGYQYLPFEVYARSDFKSTVGQAYEWSGSFHAYQQRQEAIEMGMKDKEGNPLEPLEKPGKKVSLSEGLAQWQKDLREYGLNQGFTIK